MALAADAALKKPRIFFGWWVLAATAGLSFLNGALYIYGFSAFFLPLAAEFGSSRAALSGVISMARLEGGFLAPLAGWLVDRFGPRALSLGGIVAIGAGFLLLSQVTSLTMFFIVFIFVLSNGVSFGLGIPPQTAIANWFSRRRGFALGLFNAGYGIGGALVPALAWLIEVGGWRNAAIACGLIAWGVGIPLALLLRHRPEQYGLLPDGGPAPVAATATSATAAPRAVEVDFTVKQALKTRSFWLLALPWTFWTMVSTAVTLHQIPHLIALGYSDTEAAWGLAAFASFSAFTRIGVGWLGDHMEKRKLLSACMALQSVGLVVFAYAGNAWLVALFILIFAPTWGGMFPLRGAIQGEYFGRKNYGTISGLLNNMSLVGTIVGPVAAGYAYDVMGTYSLGFVIIAGINLLAAVAILWAVRPTPPVTATAE